MNIVHIKIIANDSDFSSKIYFYFRILHFSKNVKNEKEFSTIINIHNYVNPARYLFDDCIIDHYRSRMRLLLSLKNSIKGVVL